MSKVVGRIVKWDHQKGFGFIQVSKAVPDVFAHISEFNNRAREPRIGDDLRFTLNKDSQGRISATNIAFKGERLQKPKTQRSSRSSLPVFLVLAYFVALLAAALLLKQPFYVLALHIVASFLAFAAYAKDKDQAERGRWRTKESTLHFLSLIGGWPGALLAQNRLRHKTQKLSFLTLFWLTVLLSVSATVYLHTDQAREMLKAASQADIKMPDFLDSSPQIEWSDKQRD